MLYTTSLPFRTLINPLNKLFFLSFLLIGPAIFRGNAIKLETSMNFVGPHFADISILLLVF